MNNNLIKKYLNRKMVIGGIATTRGEFIKEMLEAGHPRRCIDMYLLCISFSKNPFLLAI